MFYSDQEGIRSAIQLSESITLAKDEKFRIEYESKQSGATFIGKQQAVDEDAINKQFAKVPGLEKNAMRERLATTYVETETVTKKRLQFSKTSTCTFTAISDDIPTKFSFTLDLLADKQGLH